MKKTYPLGLLCLFTLLITSNATTVMGYTEQHPTIDWTNRIGDTGFDSLLHIAPTPNGEYICIGYTDSFSNHTFRQSLGDLWIVHLNNTGAKLQSKVIKEVYWIDQIHFIIEPTQDNGYILLATKHVAYRNEDIWVLKIDSDLNILWEKTYHQNSKDFSQYLSKTTDGGFIITAHTFDTRWYTWILKIDNQGNELWNTTFPGIGRFCYQTKDNQYITNNETTLIQLNEHGTITTTKSYYDYDLLDIILHTTNDTSLLIGSWDQRKNLALLEVDNHTNKLWTQSHNLATNVWSFDNLIQADQQGYMLVGFTDYENWFQGWILRIGPQGKLLWKQNFTNAHRLYDIHPINTTHYLVVGTTNYTHMTEAPPDGFITQIHLNIQSDNGNNTQPNNTPGFTIIILVITTTILLYIKNKYTNYFS